MCETLGVEAPSSEIFESWIFARRLFIDIANETFKGDPILPRGHREGENADLFEYFESKNVPRSSAEALIEELGCFSLRLSRALSRRSVNPQSVRCVRLSHGDVHFRVGKAKLRLNAGHLSKLKSMFQHKDKTWTKAKQKDFDDSVSALLLRYVSLQDTGMQAACPEDVFKFLHQEFSVSFECFASPLNAYFGRFCSAFPDVDHCFGSCGSFFQFFPKTGSFQANPPFTELVIKAMKIHMDSLLRQTELPLSFVVIVPAWKKSKAWAMLNKSRFMTRHVLLSQGKHGYCDG